MADLLTPEESRVVDELLPRLGTFQAANERAYRYYDGQHTAAQFGISVPPQMNNLEVALGWAGKVCDVVNARLQLQGWVSAADSNPFGLRDVFHANGLEVVSSQAHLDAMVCGCGFVVVGSGAEGEPDPLVTVHSPSNMTARYSLRTRRLESALSVYRSDYGDEAVATLYLPDETVSLVRESVGPWMVVDRDRHNLGRVPVVRVANRARTGRPFGRSEITRSIRASQDAGARQMLNMQVNAEFFAAPQRWVMGAAEEAFGGQSQWQLVQGRLLALSSDIDGNQPTVGQFEQSSPTPYLDVLRQLARQVASDADLPVRYFDDDSSEPTSADAIRADEAALVQRVKRKQSEFAAAWSEVAELALLVRDGRVPDEFRGVSPVWASAATPTRAANTDAAQKWIASGIVPASSDVILEMLDFSEFDRERIRVERENEPDEPEVVPAAEPGVQSVGPDEVDRAV